MKKIALLLIATCFTILLQAQNMGIGTTTPLMPLHVSTPTDTALLLLENRTALNLNTNVGLYLKNGNYFTGAIKNIGYGTASSRLSFFTYADANRNNLKERLSISDNGSVGVGTAIPQTRLHITNGSYYDTALLLLENKTYLNENTNVGLYLKNGNYFTGAIKTIGYGPALSRLSFFTFAHNDQNSLRERLSITDNGYVGIGNVAPITALQVSSPADSAILMLEKQTSLNEGSSVGMYFKNGSRFTGAIKTIGEGTNSARLSFYTYTGGNINTLEERISIKDNGRVGINTTNPTSQMEVAGKSKFTQGTGDDAAVEINGAIRVSGNKAAFVLTCNSANLSDVYQPYINNVISSVYYASVIIDNPICNGDPYAIIMVTPREYPHSFAIAYDNAISKWKITIDRNGVNANDCYGLAKPNSNPSCGSYYVAVMEYKPLSLSAGQKFNVMIIKQ